MNRIYIVVAAAAIILMVNGSAQTNLPPASISTTGPTGRYQLLDGEFQFIAPTEVSSHHGVFRIDTQTGVTSVYTYGTDKAGVVYREWAAIK